MMRGDDDQKFEIEFTDGNIEFGLVNNQGPKSAETYWDEFVADVKKYGVEHSDGIKKYSPAEVKEIRKGWSEEYY